MTWFKKIRACLLFQSLIVDLIEEIFELLIETKVYIEVYRKQDNRTNLSALHCLEQLDVLWQFYAGELSRLQLAHDQIRFFVG